MRDDVAGPEGSRVEREVRPLAQPASATAFQAMEAKNAALAREAHAWWTAARDAMKPRAPLTAQQLDKLIEAHVGGAELADGEYSSMVLFAAAVERAHGIGPNVLSAAPPENLPKK